MARGRPKDSSPLSYQKLYSRLQKGPLWLEDWKSTGLARSTVHERLRHLLHIGLVKSRRNGKKIEYVLSKQNNSKILSLEDIKWHEMLHPYSRKEKRHLWRRIKNTARKYLETITPFNKRLLVMEAMSRAVEDIIVKEPESQIVLKILEEIGIDYKILSTINLVDGLIFPNKIGTLCLSCLKKSVLTYLVTDYNTEEIICPKEGIVIRIERIIKPVKTIPPYNYRRFFGA